MNKQEFIDLMIEDLRELAEEEIPRYPYGRSVDGLCAYLGQRFDFYLGAIDSLWPEYSGVLGFPVPYPTSDPSLAYFDTSNAEKWQGEYGAARRRLVLFVADWLEEYGPEL